MQDEDITRQVLLPRHAIVVVAVIYWLISVIFTWPLIINFNAGNYGYAGDSPHAIWELWTTRLEWTDGRTPDELVGQPFDGGNFNRQHLPLYFALTSTGIFPSELIAYNFFAFASFPLSAIAAYLLAFKITGTHRASFVAGLIFAFGPAHYYQARDHLAFDPQWMAFFLLAFWEFEENPNLLSVLVATTTYIITITAFPYYGYFSIVLGATLVVGRILYFGWRNHFTKSRTAFYGIFIAVVLATVYLVYRPAVIDFIDETYSANTEQQYTGSRIYARDPSWPFYLSARPWDYVLPSDDHPLFGNFSRSIRANISRITLGDWVPDRYQSLNIDNAWFWNNDTGPLERTLFLSYAGIALSAYAVIYSWRSRKNHGRPSESTFGVVLFVSIFFVGIIWSGPPWIPIGSLFARWLPTWAENFVIPLPLGITFEFLPIFRAAIRAGIIVLLATGVLAAIGCAIILKRQTEKTKWMFTAFVSALILFEFSNIPPFVKLYPAPAVYSWLAQQPDGIVVSYPWGHGDDRFFQTVHRMPLAAQNNITAPTRLGNLQEYVLKDWSRLETVSKLSAIGVKYVIWHSDESPKQHESSWLRLVKEFDHVAVFEVTAEPTPLIVLYAPKTTVWHNDLPWECQVDQCVIWLWNPTDENLNTSIRLKLANVLLDGKVSATVVLTPAPETVIIDGIRRPNRLAGLTYGQNTILVNKVPPESGHLQINGLLLLPGETKMTLTWESRTMPELVQITSFNIELKDDRNKHP